MKDMIIKGTGNSRLLKSVPDFLTRYPTYEDFVSALVAGTLPFDFNGVNADGIEQMGTAQSKANLLPDDVAEKLKLANDDPTLAQAVDELATRSIALSAANDEILEEIDLLKSRIVVGSYKGTGKAGSSNPNSLTFGFAVKAIFLLAIGAAPPYVDSIYPSNNFDRLPVTALTTSYKSGFGLGGKTSSGDTLYAKRSSDYKTVSWYTSGTDARMQANISGTVYYYMAIG